MLLIRKYARSFAPALLLILLIVVDAQAAGKSTPASALKGPTQAEVTYDDPQGRSTPQGTVLGFLKAMQREDFEQAIDYLDTRQTGKRAEKLAGELFHILNVGQLAATATLSSKPEGNLQDGLPVNRDTLGVVKTKKGEYRILLERVQRENNPPIWLFSSETLKLVPQIYEEIDIPWLEQQLPPVLTESKVVGYSIYRLFFIVLALPLAFGAGWLLTKLLSVLMRGPLRRRFDEPFLQKIARTRTPLLLIFAAAVILACDRFALSLLTRIFFMFVASTMAVVGLVWLVIHFIEAGAEIIEKRRPEAANAVIRLSATLLKTLAVIIGLVVIFYYFAGINLTAVVAGLGVGGIAVAFAAQKTIENFLGGLFLVWDKPIRLGDVCKAGDYTGTVEHIGIRSTQIRTPSRTVVSIPNGLLSSISVENLTQRDSILFKHTLNLRYETTADQLRYILAQIRELLYQHPRVDSTTARIRFVGFGQSSIDLEIFAYVLETEYEAFLPVQEDLLLRIMDLVEASGSGLAFPSQTVYMSKDGGLDMEKGRAAAEAVKKWRDQGELPFPDHRPARVSQLDDTLDYPPKGSVLSKKKEGD
jgi:MscS family membrane protein